MDALPRADRLSDEISDSPYWNESAWFNFNKPDEGLNGVVQYYFRPNMGMLNGGPIIWDRSGHFQWNCLYYNWSNLQALPAGAEKYNMKANNSLEVKVLEPLSRYSIKYDNEGLQMDLLWEAIGPMHEMKSGGDAQVKTSMFHIEQPGTMKGMIRVGERDIAIDCYSMRDASAGPRQYEKVAPGSYFWGVAGDSCFHAIAMGDGPVHQLMGGFIWKDGKMSTLASGTRTALEFGRYGPSRLRFEGADELGRSFVVEGRIEQGFIHTGYSTHSVVWSLAEWNWDGVIHIGELQEFCPAVRFRKIARGELKLG